MSSESETKNRLTIIIPTVNNIKGMEYLKNYFKNKEYQVIVVDNGLDSRLRGNDNREVGNDTGKLVYFHQEKNLGFAGGVNKGTEDVKTKWILILNDDIEFQRMDSRLRGNDNREVEKDIRKSETIESLIKYAEENNLDAVSPILRNPNGEVENYGYRVLPYGKIELVRKMDSRLRGNDNNIDGITAACLLVKTEVFKKLGGFDESFFAYLEDVDFFLRLAALAQDRSFGIAYDVEVLHNHMTTTKTMGNFKARQDMVNWWRLFFKHPDKFKLNLDFIIERLRNVSGFIKATIRSI